MTDYRRIVSYLYKYEHGKKGENVGYVRIEIRKGILKLLIHVQDSHALREKDFTVYFYYYKNDYLRGIEGGTMRFRQEEGEFRRETKENQIFDSNFSLEEVNGLLIYYNNDLAYGTQWDDKPIQIEKFQIDEEIAEQTELNRENMLKNSKQLGSVPRNNVEEQTDILKTKLEENILQDFDLLEPIIEETIEENVHQDFEQLKPIIEETIEEQNDILDNNLQEKGEQQDFDRIENSTEKLWEQSLNEVSEAKSFVDIAGLNLDQETLKGLQAIYQGDILEPEPIGEKELQTKAEIQQETARFQSLAESQQLLDQLLNMQPRISQLANRDILIMVRIHPQDIGKLSISNWHLGSNSFLIHAFYQFHYIVAGKLLNQDGTVRGVLGVPGIYNNEERYMADQFGFREFLSVKPVQIKTGSFGYWIVDLL